MATVEDLYATIIPLGIRCHMSHAASLIAFIAKPC